MARQRIADYIFGWWATSTSGGRHGVDGGSSSPDEAGQTAATELRRALAWLQNEPANLTKLPSGSWVLGTTRGETLRVELVTKRRDGQEAADHQNDDWADSFEASLASGLGINRLLK